MHGGKFTVKYFNIYEFDVQTVATGRSPAEILGSNPTGGMDICLL